MAQIGNKQNSYLNGEWGKHGRPFTKSKGNKRRRKYDLSMIKESCGETHHGKKD